MQVKPCGLFVLRSVSLHLGYTVMSSTFTSHVNIYLLMFHQVALNLGNASSTAAHGRPDQSLPSSLSSSNEPISAPSPPPAQQLPSPVLPASSAPLLPILDSSSRNNSNNSRLTNLVKPITFFTPSPYSSPLMIPTTSLCIPTAPSLPPPPLHPLVGPQRPPSLTPASAPTYRPEFTREKVRNALLRVIQVCNLSSSLTFLLVVSLISIIRFHKQIFAAASIK